MPLAEATKDQAADRKVTILFSPGQTVSSDIDGAKRILRSRGPVKDFLERSGLKAGDQVRLTRTGSYSYHIASVAPTG